jgi:tripartite-type tricarboxylate transporter receptor subunit TctC
MTRITSLLSLFLFAMCTHVLAQSYPSRPVRIVVPFPAGGPSDVLVRAMAQKMTEGWGQPVIVENKPGANTIIGAESVAKSAPDGYTLLMVIDSTLTMNPSLYSRLPYDPIKDFAPITAFGFGGIYLMADAAKGPTSIQELIQFARTNPGKLNLGGGTIISQLAFEVFKRRLGLDIGYVPYKGSAGTSQGLLTGDVPVTIDGLTSYIPYIKAGRVRPIGTFTARPLPGITGIPTVAEAANLPGLDIGVWLGLVAPAGTPPAVINRIHEETARALALAEVKERFATNGFEAATNSPGEFAKMIRDQIEYFRPIIKDVGLKLD